MEARRDSGPAIKLAAATRKPRTISHQKNGFLRKFKVAVSWNQPDILCAVTPQLIHLQRYECLCRGQHPLSEHQHLIHPGSPCEDAKIGLTHIPLVVARGDDAMGFGGVRP